MSKDLPLAVIVDIDGTVAHVTDRKHWDWKKVSSDVPNAPVVDYVRMVHEFGARVIYMTGRSEVCRRDTEVWLEEHVGVPYEMLLMRPVSAVRTRDDHVKYGQFKESVQGSYRVHSVLEDRTRVVEMWRALGLTVLQVAEGGF